MDYAKFFGLLTTAVLLSIILSLLLSWPIMILWNAFLVPSVQGTNEITWIQAWGLSVLCGLLFKSNVTTKE